MQTWRVRMIGRNGFNLTKRQALWRYVYGSLWILPCVLLQWMFHLEKWYIIEMLFAVALFIWPLSTFLDRRNADLRQSLPDRLASSRLVELPKN
jgi:4-hydroxybenzoate polyprenyltransferase